MNYQVIPPPAKLAEYVRFFWVLESSEPYIHQHTADGCAELLFHYSGTFDELTKNGRERSALSMIQGPTSQYTRYETHSGFGIFGVYLYPYALPGLLSATSAEISNQAPDLYTLFGRQGKELEEKMMLAHSNHERKRIISSFLERRLFRNEDKDPRVFYSISSIIQTGGCINIFDLADSCFLSRRQFERRFKHYAGFSPKTYSRIIRFQAAANEYGNYQKSLAQIALDCGYYDQSHFIHDFKKFSGCNPKAYFSGDATGFGWRDATD